jgi:hypothetical protein
MNSLVKRILLAAAAIGLVVAGGLAERFWMGHSPLNASLANLYLMDRLSQGRAGFTPMKMIADGKGEAAYQLLESEVIGTVFVANDFPEVTEEGKREAGAFIGRVHEFYDSHPDRKAALQSKYPDIFAIVISRPLPK